jgi:teichoic acid transport system permease protein
MSATAPQNGSGPVPEVQGSEVSATDTFIKFGQQPTLGQYVNELWERREFSVYVPYQELRVQKMNTVLGQLWHFLNPALTVVIYYVIFAVILDVSRGVDNFIGFLVIGVLMFTVTQRIIMDALTAIERDSGLIRSVEFPRALLPISSVFGQTMAFLPAIPVIFVALMVTGDPPTLRWLFLPLLLVAHLGINLGLGLMAARAGFAVRDLRNLMEHITRVLFYGSGALFPIERFVENETMRDAFVLNPIYAVLTSTRWALQGIEVSQMALWATLIYALVLPSVGLVVFMRGEHKYGGSV